MTWRYEDFSLHIALTDTSLLTINLISSPAGEGSTKAAIPLTTEEINNVHTSLDPSLLNFDHLGGKLSGVGSRLFDAVFSGIVAIQFRRSLDLLPQETGLRIRLRLDPEVAALGLPWELLYDSTREKFLNLSPRTPIVRHMPLPTSITPLLSEPPLRIVVVVAEPLGTSKLGGEQEWRRIDRAFSDLQDKGRVELARPSAATFEDLGRVLDSRKHQILHFIGHGDAAGVSGESVVHFEERGTRQDRPISGRDLGTLVTEHPSIRLVFLNCCEGASFHRTDMTGMATALVRNGVPAVVAMQNRISDEVAAAFSDRLYQEIALGEPIDAAVAIARADVHRRAAGAEWSTPTLYMRASDGTVLKPQARQTLVKPSTEPDLLPGNIRSVAAENNSGRLIRTFQSSWLPAFLLAMFASIVTIPIVTSSMIEGPLGEGYIFSTPLSKWIWYPYELILFILAAGGLATAHSRLGRKASIGLGLGFACFAPIMVYSSQMRHTLILTYAGWTLGLSLVALAILGYRRLSSAIQRIRRRNRRV